MNSNKAPTTIKILSYNIHKGFDWSGRKLTIQGIKDALKEAHADIIFLQEIVGEHKQHEKNFKEWPSSSQFEFLADTIWGNHAYAKNSLFIHGHYGNAILSKFPIISWEKQDISTNRWEQRGLLYCNIKIGEHILHAYCLHLDLFHRGRKQQYHAIYERIHREVEAGQPVIVAGDFNDWNKKSKDVFEKSLEMREAFKTSNGDYARTYPAKLPLLPLDRIYSRHILPSNVRILNDPHWRDLSDHLPLYAEFTFPNP